MGTPGFLLTRRFKDLFAFPSPSGLFSSLLLHPLSLLIPFPMLAGDLFLADLGCFTDTGPSFLSGQ